MTLDDLLPILRCPVSGSPLEHRGASLMTSDGRHTYPIVGGVPILIDGEASVFSVQDIAASATAVACKPPISRRVARRIIPSATESIGTEARYAEFERLVRDLAGARRPRILVVGGGSWARGWSA